MSQRNVTYLTDAMLITCVLQNGLAEEVLEAAKNAGAQGARLTTLVGQGPGADGSDRGDHRRAERGHPDYRV